MRLLTTLVVALVLGTVAAAQWGTQPRDSVESPSVSTSYLWRIPGDGWYHLYKGPSQVGSWHASHGYWRLDAGKWQRSTLPVNLPDGVADEHGVVADKIDDGGYKLNGKRCSKDEAYRRIEQSPLIDDSKKLRLLIIGQRRDEVLAAIKADDKLKELCTRFIVQSYPSDHWHVAEVGFKTDGNPSIYFLKPHGDGKATVLLRLDEFTDATKLAGAVSYAIRKADPDYDPNNDPKMPKPKPSPTPTPDSDELPPFTWAGVGALLMLILQYLVGKKKV